MQRGWSPACHSIITQILIRAVLVCALLFPLIQARPCFLPCSMSVLNFQKNGSRAAQSCTPFLYEIIHPSGRSQLANTQVPVICSKCVILALVALFLGRADRSHAVICALLFLPLSTMSSQLELRFGAGPFEMVEKYAKQHNASLQSLAPDPCILQWWTRLALAPLAGIWPSINLCLALTHSQHAGVVGEGRERWYSTLPDKK